MDKKVSIIIPAYNQEECIQRTIESYKSEDYPLEVIVVVNNSDDATYDIAKRYADKVLNFPDKIGVCAARNEGAKVAEGEILIFSDADSVLEENSIKKIVYESSEKTIGAPLAKTDGRSFRGKIFFLFKEWTHRLKIYQGVPAGVFVCHKNIFLETGGFDENKKIAEFYSFIENAKKAGAEYKLFEDCYATTSTRRFEKQGYFKIVAFWMRWRVLSVLELDDGVAEEYFE